MKKGNYRTLIGLMLFVLFLGSNTEISKAGETKNNKVAAKVNGEIILLEDIDSILKQRGPSLVPLTQSQLILDRRQTLELLITECLVRQYFKEAKITVPKSEVDKGMIELIGSLKQEGKTLEDYLKENNQTESQLRATIYQLLQMSQFMKTSVTEEKLKPYYEQNKDFFDKTTVQVSHIVIRVAQNAKPEEKQNAYDRLKKIREEIINKKKDFASAAKEYSQCPSAPNGGDLGFISRKFQVDESIAKTAFSLNIGEISDIVESEFGYHILMVTEKKAGRPSNFEKSLADVKDSFEVELKQNLIHQLRSRAKIEIFLPEK